MTAILNTLCLMVMAIEISAAKWIVASTASGVRKPRRKTLDQEQVSERFEALMAEIEAARAHLHVGASARLLVAYEAGQEGFWSVRALRARGIDAEVIDPVSLQVDRKARRVKSDRVDAEALVAALYRYASGEERALRMVRVPTTAWMQEAGVALAHSAIAPALPYLRHPCRRLALATLAHPCAAQRRSSCRASRRRTVASGSASGIGWRANGAVARIGSRRSCARKASGP